MAFLNTPVASPPNSPGRAFRLDSEEAEDILVDKRILTTDEVAQNGIFEQLAEGPVSSRSESDSSSQIEFGVSLEQPSGSRWSIIAKKVAKTALVLIVVTGIFIAAGFVLAELSVSVQALAIIGGVSVLILGTGWLLSRPSKKQSSEESPFQMKLGKYYENAKERRAKLKHPISSRSNSSASSLDIRVLDSDNSDDDDIFESPHED